VHACLGDHEEVPLETERLILNPWQNSDWAAFRPIAEDAAVMRYINGGIPWNEEQIRDFVDRQVTLHSDRGFCRWKLEERASGELIGFCGAGIWRDAVDPEIGWWLARRCWGRGLATEAAQIALRDLFERVRLERVISVAMPENRASLRVMEKLGLRFRHAFESGGTPLVQYGIEATDWNQKPQQPEPIV
jgi:RimJ/RimL family protein N-acetyltransferase